MKNQQQFIFIVYGFFLLLILISCKRNYQQPIVNSSNDITTDFFINANELIIQDEEKKIDSLLKKTHIPFLKDTTGIRISINQKVHYGTLSYPEDGDYVTVLYNCLVFDDVESIFNNLLIDTLSFKIGFSKQMRGLNYAIKLLKVGDKAKIIIPSYLGFGMSGYGKTVPPYSTLILNVKLLNIEK